MKSPADFKLIIFDWDGTLFRSIDLIQNSIIAAARAQGVVVDANIARSIIGLGLKAAQDELFPGAHYPKEFYTNFHRAYREHYEAGEAAIALYDGAYELIRDLKGEKKTIAIATAKSRAGINRSLTATGLHTFVSHSRTPEECRPKPDPHMIEEILAESGIDRSQALMVGDTTHDLKMAANAGVVAVGITHGAHDSVTLLSVNPAFIYHSIAELRAGVWGPSASIKF